MRNYPFIPDLVTSWARLLADPGPPSDDVLREIARALDYVILMPPLLSGYCQRLRPQLGPFHARYRIDQAAGRPKDVDDIPYLKPLDDEDEQAILETPLRDRDVAWLREHRVDLLALNSPALEGLQEAVLEEMPEAWMRLFEDEEWLRRIDHPKPPTTDDLLAALGVDEEDGTTSPAAALAGARGHDESRAGDGAAAVGPAKPVLVTVSIDEIPDRDTTHRENIAVPTATFEVRYGGNRIIVTAGGFAFVENDCTLVLRWLKADGTLNGSATLSATTTDRALRIDGEEAFDFDQRIEFRFERRGHRPYSVESGFGFDADVSSS